MNRILKTYLILAVLLAINLAFFTLPKQAKAASASFFLSPSSNQVNVGATVSAKVMVSSDAAINAGEGSVSYASDILEYQSVSTAGSIFSFWTSGPAGSESGVSFGGGLANPGYSGGGGTILTITWKAKAAGTATISISGSRILANDGLGTNIYSGSSGGTITVGSGGSTRAPSQATTVTSTSHPDQNAWYNQKKADLSWSAKSAQGYSFTLDQAASTTPNVAVTSTTKKSYDIANDGVWYFHVRAKFDSGFGPVTHFKIQVDTVPPDPFTITINQEGGTKNPTPIVTFEAKDATSGIDHYEAVIDGGTPVRIASGDKLPKQRPGDHTLIIKAYDKAGNVRDSQSSSFHIEGIPAPKILRWDKIVGLLEPIHFVGESSPDDTIIIILGDEEVARFKASDYKTSEEPTDPATQIVWDYSLKKILMVGTYNFRIGLIDKNEAESELAGPLKVRVVASYVKIFGFTIPSIYLLILLLIIIIALIVIIILLLKKLRELARSGRGPVGFAYARISRMFARTEREIDHEIDTTIPQSDLSGGVVKEVKKDLKAKVHETISEEKREIGEDN